MPHLMTLAEQLEWVPLTGSSVDPAGFFVVGLEGVDKVKQFAQRAVPLIRRVVVGVKGECEAGLFEPVNGARKVGLRPPCR